MPKKKKSDEERKIAKLQADLKEMEPYSGDYWVGQSKRNTQSELWELSKKQIKNNMRGIAWDDADKIVKLINEVYPHSKLSKSTDKNLLGVMKVMGMLDVLPEIDGDTRKNHLRMIKESSRKFETEQVRKLVEEAENTNDQHKLAEIAKSTKEREVYTAAINKITNQDLLVDIALSVGVETFQGSAVGFKAIKKLTDQNLLFGIFKKSVNRHVREAAINALTDRDMLTEIINGGDKYIVWMTTRESDEGFVYENKTRIDFCEVARNRLEKLR